MLIIEVIISNNILLTSERIERFIGLSPYHWEKENLSFIFREIYL